MVKPSSSTSATEDEEVAFQGQTAAGREAGSEISTTAHTLSSEKADARALVGMMSISKSLTRSPSLRKSLKAVLRQEGGESTMRFCRTSIRLEN
eukprot:scaffold5636_cov159-Ochromonas_danica.AAC.21